MRCRHSPGHRVLNNEVVKLISRDRLVVLGIQEDYKSARGTSVLREAPGRDEPQSDRVHVPRARQHSREIASAGCFADSTHGKSNRSAALTTAAHICLQMWFSAGDGDVPFPKTAAHTRLSSSNMMRCRCHRSEAANLRTTRRATRHSPRLMWSSIFHAPLSKGLQRALSKMLWCKQVRGLVRRRGASGRFRPDRSPLTRGTVCARTAPFSNTW